MTEQLALLTVPAAAKPATRTGLVLTAIRAAGDAGLHPDEVGAVLHAHDGKHDAGDRCEWCGRDGTRLLRRLHRERLVSRRHGNAAVAVDESPDAAAKTVSGMSDRIPF